MTVPMPSISAASNTSSGAGTGTVVPLPSGLTNDSEARNAWPVGAASPCAASDGGERLGAAHEVVGLDRGEAARREVGEGAVEVGLERLAGR